MLHFPAMRLGIAALLIVAGCASTDQTPDSIEAIDRAIEARPWDAQLHLRRAQALTALGRYDEAVVSCVRACERDPSNWPVWYELGLSRIRANQPQAAIEALERALQLAPEDTKPRCRDLLAELKARRQ